MVAAASLGDKSVQADQARAPEHWSQWVSMVPPCQQGVDERLIHEPSPCLCSIWGVFYTDGTPEIASCIFTGNTSSVFRFHEIYS